jgi:hypothetical protein
MIRREQIATLTHNNGRVIFTALPAFQHVIPAPTDCGAADTDEARQTVDALYARCRRDVKLTKAMKVIVKARRLAAEFNIPLAG